MNKAEEFLVAKFFIEHLNAQYGLTYKAIPNNDEGERDGDVDIYALSDNREALNLQIKNGEPGLARFFGRRKKMGSGMGHIGGKIEETITQIIRSAEQKYSDSNKLILLISERHSPLIFDEKFAAWLSNRCCSPAFKGVYIVKLPIGRGSHPYTGQIVAIKDIFENHGVIF